MAFKITSEAFKDRDPIPREYGCDGQDLSPAIKWEGAPKGTKSFILIADDPDAPSGVFTHWVIYDIPGGSTGLPKGLSPAGAPDSAMKQGVNDFGRIGYAGPCPPRGHGRHRYYFKLQALDTASLNLAPGRGRKEVEKAAKGRVLGAATVMGTYER